MTARSGLDESAPGLPPAAMARPRPAPPGGRPGPDLGQVVDATLEWLFAWQRAVLFPHEVADWRLLAPPDHFARWCEARGDRPVSDQPIVDRLHTLHTRLETTAGRVEGCLRDGRRPTPDEVDAVAACVRDYLLTLRRVERAFAVAASRIDPLTGLRTRAEMDDEIGRELDRARRTGTPISLAVCDIDRFKSVNDTHGHEVGDRVLATVASALLRRIRSFDDAYRLGGEEFVLCLKDADLATALAVTERLRAEVEATPTPLPTIADTVSPDPMTGGRTLRVTASFGVAQARAGEDVHLLRHRADLALYRAKQAGRNRVEAAE